MKNKKNQERLYTKNLHGRLARIVKVNDTEELGTIETVFRYNSKGEVIKKYEQGSTVEYEYSPSGSVKSIKYPDEKNTIINYDYDHMGRVKGINNGATVVSKDYSYDYLGRNITKTLGDMKIVYAYNFQGDLEEIGHLKGDTSIFKEQINYYQEVRDTSKDLTMKIFANNLVFDIEDTRVVLSEGSGIYFVFEYLEEDIYRIKSSNNETESYWRRGEDGAIYADADEEGAAQFYKYDLDGTSFYLEVPRELLWVDALERNIVVSDNFHGLTISAEANHDGAKFRLNNRLVYGKMSMYKPEGLINKILMNELENPTNQNLFELEFDKGSYKIKDPDSGNYLYEMFDTTVDDYVYVWNSGDSTNFNINTYVYNDAEYGEILYPVNTDRLVTVEEVLIGLQYLAPAVGRSGETGNLGYKHFFNLVTEDGERLIFPHTSWVPRKLDSRYSIEGYQHGFIGEVNFSGEQYNDGKEINIKYNYDYLKRLSSSERITPDGKSKNNYIYDKNGNILFKDSNKYDYQGFSNRLTKITNPEGEVVNKLEYDELGAVVKMNRTDEEEMSFTRCPITNKITNVVIGDFQEVSFKYNGEGRRIEKIVRCLKPKVIFDIDRIEVTLTQLGEIQYIILVENISKIPAENVEIKDILNSYLEDEENIFTNISSTISDNAENVQGGISSDNSSYKFTVPANQVVEVTVTAYVVKGYETSIIPHRLEMIYDDTKETKALNIKIDPVTIAFGSSHFKLNEKGEVLFTSNEDSDKFIFERVELNKYAIKVAESRDYPEHIGKYFYVTSFPSSAYSVCKIILSDDIGLAFDDYSPQHPEQLILKASWHKTLSIPETYHYLYRAMTSSGYDYVGFTSDNFWITTSLDIYFK